jgi:hypothetical protein
MRFVLAASFVVAAFSGIAGYYAQETLRDQFLVNAFVVVFMVSGASLMFFIATRDKLARCPECKSWLRSKGRVSEGGTRIFTCVRCGIDWDAKVQVSGAGEG